MRRGLLAQELSEGREGGGVEKQRIFFQKPTCYRRVFWVRRVVTEIMSGSGGGDGAPSGGRPQRDRSQVARCVESFDSRAFPSRPGTTFLLSFFSPLSQSFWPTLARGKKNKQRRTTLRAKTRFLRSAPTNLSIFFYFWFF